MNTYPVTQTTDLLAIPECKYAVGAQLKFTKFTSCLGLFCKVNGKDEVIGIHLVLIDGSGHAFTAEDISSIRNILTNHNAQLETGWVVGCLDFWQEDILNEFSQLFGDNEAHKMNKCDVLYNAEISGDTVIVSIEE